MWSKFCPPFLVFKEQDKIDCSFLHFAKIYSVTIIVQNIILFYVNLLCKYDYWFLFSSVYVTKKDYALNYSNKFSSFEINITIKFVFCHWTNSPIHNEMKLEYFNSFKEWFALLDK